MIEQLPAPVIERYGRVNVLRDDLIEVGSKARFLLPLLRARPEIRQWVYGSCPATGWGQISLPAACSQLGVECHLFMAKRAQPNALQRRAQELGAVMHWVPNGMLTTTEARAREYVAQSPDRALLPIGLADELVIEEIARIARELPVTPSEVWSVGSSGTLSQGLQRAWPDVPVHFVMVGHRPSAEQLGRARLWEYPGAFDKPCRASDAPPYPSVATYDAKVWTFASAYAKRDALVWNVAADLEETP